MIALFGGRDPRALGGFETHSFRHLPRNNACLRMMRLVPRYSFPKRRRKAHEIYEALVKVIPPGATVSAPEFVYPALYKRNLLQLFPIGLDSADYALMGVDYVRGPEERRRLEIGLRERMARVGYDLDNPLMVGTLEVYRRTAGRAASQ